MRSLVPIEQRDRDTGTTFVALEVLTKDVRCLQFVFADKAGLDRVLMVLRQFAFSEPEFLFAFQHRPKPAATEAAAAAAGEHAFDGWDLYDIERDLRRQGVFTSRMSDGRPTWRITDLNHDFKFSPTYPRCLVVPTAMSNAQLVTVGTFRSRARIPALTFMHPGNRTTLWRSSQPLVGVGGKTNAEDERLLDCIRASCGASAGQRLLIADCRPMINALGNKAKGKGYETYKHGELVFMNIQSIHVMRDSINKLKALCLAPSKSSDDSWLEAVESTGWLKHVRLVLAGAIRVAASMHRGGQSVLCHCSDGWDRTAQVCCLAQMMLDPYYRTTEGFLALICKDWLMFGHQFHVRIGHGEKNAESSERSPVFLQFLECVWQLIDQHPTIFEFSSQLLLFIAHHLYSCRFGDFLFNCERERREVDTFSKTASMWGYILARPARFANPYWVNNGDTAPVFIPPLSATVRNVRFWADYFLRFSPVPSLPYAAVYTSTFESAAGGEPGADGVAAAAAATAAKILPRAVPEEPASGGSDDSDGEASGASEAASVTDSEDEEATVAAAAGVADDPSAAAVGKQGSRSLPPLPRRTFLTSSDAVETAMLRQAQAAEHALRAAGGAGPADGFEHPSAGGAGGPDGSARRASTIAASSAAGGFFSYHRMARHYDHSRNVQHVVSASADQSGASGQRARGVSTEDAEALGLAEAFGKSGVLTSDVGDGTPVAGGPPAPPAATPAPAAAASGAADVESEEEYDPFAS